MKMTLETGRRRGAGSFLAAVFAILLLCAGPRVLQAAMSDQPVAFTIPAGSLSASLNAVAIQANLQIFFEQSTVDGLNAPAINETMPARQALERLLEKTSLEYFQNSDDTILIRRKSSNPPVLAHAKHRPSKVAVPAAAAPIPAEEEIPATEGDWILRARGTYLEPRNHSNAITIANAGLAIPGDGVTTTSRWYPEIDLEHFWSKHWSTEVAVSIPERQDVDVAPAPGFLRVRAGTFKLGMNDVTMKYTFASEGPFRPYVGAGIDYAVFSKELLSPYGLNSSSVGPVAQTGFDLRIGRGWFLNADFKWTWLRPDLHYAGAPAGRFNVDPLRFSIGIGYRFGGTPARRVAVAAVPAPVAAPVAVLDSDGDSVPDDRDQCPNTPAGVHVDAKGCPLDSDGDGVPDYLDRCPGTPPNLKVDANGCEVEELILKGVNFQTGSANLTADSTTTLDAVAAILRQRPNAKVEVHGYTDSVGSDRLNQRLSEQRAQSVVIYFRSVGIASQTLSARGFGKSNPVASNDTAEGRAQNRRVTVQFMSPVAR